MRKVRFGLTCPEAIGKSVLPGQLVEPDNYIWIYVVGGARTLGYRDEADSKRYEPVHGLPKDLLLRLEKAISSAIKSAFDDANKLNIVVADAFLHTPCRIDRRLKYQIRPQRRSVLEQASITFRELLELDKDRRKSNNRPSVSLSGLTTRAYDLGNLGQNDAAT